jgi:SNF2 family DNA or RNA helicase
MLREEQIDLRRERAKAGKFRIENLSKKKVFSKYRVINPETGGEYEVSIRGFDTGDNACTCPDFKSNTLGTCKHILAVLDELKEDLPAQLQKKKAVIVRPEIGLHYGEQLTLAIQLPPRHSDKLKELSKKFFDERGQWHGKGRYEDLIPAIERVPEEITVMSDALDFLDREVERAEMLRKEDEWLKEMDDGTFPRDLLRCELYDYQLRGAIFLACRGRAILGDDMGLGKTIQTLAAVEWLARQRGISRVLVVAPSSVKYQWDTEIRKFTARAVQVIDGSPEERAKQYAEPTFYRLVNYEQVVRERAEINAWKADVVIIDEAQRIKNWASKTSREVKKLQSRYAMVLTGTPLENKLEELHSIVQFIDERRFGPAFQFLQDHRVMDEKGNLVGYRNLDAIREKLAPIFLRRTRGEVLTQLPERTDSTRFVELSDEQRGPYEEQKAALAKLVQKNFQTDLDRKRILACLANMRMLCDSTFLFDKTTRVSPKLDEFAELVPELIGDSLAGRASDGTTSRPSLARPANKQVHKLVVFSQWETMIDEAAKVLEKQGIEFALLHGGLSGKERKAALEAFAENPDCAVFLSTDAGGTGLNLQMADTVVNLELPWNPAVLEQRIARVHRMGQSRPVRVVNFVTRGTIEEKVLKTLEQKQALFDGLFEGEEDEITLGAVNPTTFLKSVRELLKDPKPDDELRALPRPGSPGMLETDATSIAAGIDLFEKLAAWLSSPAVRAKLSEEQLKRINITHLEPLP